MLRAFRIFRHQALVAFACLACNPIPGRAESPVDWRVPIVERQLAHDLTGALELVNAQIAEDPSRADEEGLHYLRGHLLLRLDRRTEALQAFADTLATPSLAPWARYRLAVEEAESDHPEVAAGLVATLLGSRPPRSLIGPSVDLLERTLDAGGDCRLLVGLSRLRLATPERRRLDLARALCARRDGDPEEAGRRLLALLDEDTRDDVALRAAEILAPTLEPRTSETRSAETRSPEARAKAPAGPPAARPAFLVGLAYHHHREFEIALRHLALALLRLPGASDVSASETFELRYALGRSYFWLARYPEAAKVFGALASKTNDRGRQARALYQRARCFELLGVERWDVASLAFQEVIDADPSSGWASAARIARVRLEWLRGREETSLAVLDELLDRGEVTNASRALLFLAASEIVQGRAQRAEGWLATAERLRRLDEVELSYWQGRAAEIAERHGEAVKLYLDALLEDPYHPLGRSAGRRLAGETLAATARAEVLRRARSGRTQDLYAAWLVLGDADTVGRQARLVIERRLAGDARAAPFVQLDRVPAGEWPLWRGSLSRPEERLLALGLLRDAPRSSVMRHFPMREPALAFTGSLALSREGAVRRSLYLAEILAQRVPDDVPVDFLPDGFRQLLYPLRYSYLILKEAKTRDIDPHLLAAIVREESRFDPDAFSGASARGLTQFVVPTARDIAGKIGLVEKPGDFEPRSLHRPEVAIALGAAYLRQLEDDLGELEEVVAAYNAGEPQAELWRRYCLSDEREEYLAKIAFRETRHYLRKVLTSRAHYRALYGSSTEATSPDR